MRLGWLLPDPAQDVLFDGWKKPPYQPRHGKPPAVLRATRSAVTVVVPVLDRYLGASGEEAVPGAARPAS
jgi:hypothetical protein